MNLVQKQVQSQEVPESLESLFTEMVDFYLDYYRTTPGEVIDDYEMLMNYESFPEVVGRAFLGTFGKMIRR